MAKDLWTHQLSYIMIAQSKRKSSISYIIQDQQWFNVLNIMYRRGIVKEIACILINHDGCVCCRSYWRIAGYIINIPRDGRASSRADVYFQGIE